MILALLSLSVLFLQAVNVVHLPPANYTLGSPTELRLEVMDGWNDLSEAKIQYRIVGEKRWFSETLVPETPEGPWLKGNIPAQMNATHGLEYYFELYLVNGAIESLPIVDPASKAYTLQLFQRQGDLSKSFILLSDEGAFSEDDGYILAVSFFDVAEIIDPASIKVFVNGADVTSWASIGSTTVTYREEKPTMGIKSALVSANLKSGEPIYSDTWLTDVTPGKGRGSFPIAYRGSWNFTSNVYGYAKDDSAVIPGKSRDDASSTLDLYGQWKIVDFQSNLMVSSREKTNKQPVNRYTFGFQMPYWESFFGDYSPSISQFTMNGKNIRGIYSRFYAPMLSLTWAHGQMIRKTNAVGDSTLIPGIFRQEAIAGRVQFGPDDGFSIGLNFARNRDIISSLALEDYATVLTDANEAPMDTLYSVLPQDNLNFSGELRIQIPKQNVFMGLEYAMSLYNRNTIGGSMTSEEIEEYIGENLPFNVDDFSGIFTVNKNIEPFMPGRANAAFTAYFRSYFKFMWDNLFNISYSEIGSAFKSLSTNNMQTDTKVVTVNHQMNYLQYFFLNGGYTKTVDNLMKHRSETNSYDSYFAQSIIRIPRYPYLKLSYFANSGSNELNNSVADTLAAWNPYERNSNTISVGMGYNFVQIPHVPTQVDVTYRSGLEENSSNDLLVTDNQNTGINVSLSSTYDMIPLKTQIAFATNSQDLKVGDLKNKTANFYLRAEYSLWENKIKPHLQYRNVSLGGDQNNQGYGYYTIGFDAYPLKDMSVSSSLGIKSYANDSVSDTDYSATTWRFSITQRF